MLAKERMTEILHLIYNANCDQKDMAAIIRRIHQALDDSFYENPPNFKQKETLCHLLKIADRVEEFFK